MLIFEFDITVRNPAANFIILSEIRLINNAIVYCFKEAFLATTGGSDLDYNKCVGHVSTNMGALTSKDGDLLSHF